MATELGTAYISIVPSTKDFDSGMRRVFSNTGKQAEKAGDDMGGRMASRIAVQMGRGGVGAGDAFGKSFGGKLGAVGKTAMVNMTNLMSGLADGMGSQVGGRFAGSMATGIARSSGTAVRALSGVGSAATGIGTAATVAGAATVAAVAAIGVAAVAAGSKLYQMGEQWDTISDNLAIKTGLIGRQFDEVSKSIDNVVTRTAAAPGAVADVAATLVQTLHLQGAALETVTQQIADYNDMNAQAPLNVREFAKVMKQFKVDAEDVPEVLDRLNVVAQDTGMPINDLVASMKTAGPQAKQFGLSIDGLAKLMATFEDAGLDGSSAATALRVALGSLAKSKPGQDPVVALKATVEQIENLANTGRETAAIDMAKSTFGRGWSQIFDLIKNGRFDLDNMNTAVDTQGRKISDLRTRTKDWREDWNQLKNTISEALKPLTTTIFDTLQRALQNLDDWIRRTFDLGPVGPTGTANAAGGAAPFNAGPRAPFGNYPSRAGLAPGTRLDGSDQGLSATQSTTGLPGLLAPDRAAAPFNLSSAGSVYGLPAGTNTGGYGNPAAAKTFPPWVMQLGEKFGVKPSTYPNHQSGSGLNQGIDWVGTVEQMQAFAQFLTSTKPPGLEQVIWQNPNTLAMLGLTPSGEVVTKGGGYYRDDWAGHQNHVHTKFSQNLVVSGYSKGGGVWGAGTGTSDSIPAMLSNGEHVLTARDVNALGGQDGVYAFRAALQQGLIPGYNDGGAVVDPTKLRDYQNQLADLQTSAQVAQKQLDETLADQDATPNQRLSATIAAQQAQRRYNDFAADLPILQSGGTPPDRSLQNRIYDTYDTERLRQAELDDLKARVANGETVPDSQMLAAEGAARAATRDRLQAYEDGKAAGTGSAPPSFTDELLRTAGFTPTGGIGKAGTSSLANFIGMGGDIVNNLIDTGASLVETAASAAMTAAGAGAGGGGALGGPAAGALASYGVKLGAAQLKRIVSYGFQLGGIGADSVIAQLFPFGGPPRWMGYDYTQFMPQVGIMSAATTTLEKMGQQYIAQRFGLGQPGLQFPAVGSPVQSGTITAPGQPGAAGQAGAPVPGDSIYDFQLGQLLDPSQRTPDTAPPPGGWLEQFDWFRNRLFGGMKDGGAVFDKGGMLQPGQVGINLSNRPEPVLTGKQWEALMTLGEPQQGQSGPLVKIDTIYGMDPADVANQIEAKQRLAMMRYTGRPFK